MAESRFQFQNPVIAGFYPDPSVCRVGKDYYLVTSSFEYFPGVPIFHSLDLVHWRQIGHCLTRNDQVTLVGSSAGIYAPTIRHHDGRFYMVTTSIGGGGNFYVWADDPAEEWSEPLWVDQCGIDPSLLFDDDGVVYFTSESAEGIQQSVIDIATGRLASEPRVIWPGTGGRNPEAPHLYKLANRYYLMIAEGGTEYGHMETIVRSDSPWGPFEPCPRNPILTHRNRGGHPIQATGHADLVEAQDGSWWAVFLAIRPAAVYPPWHNLGRESFLAPVTWSQDGWPTIGADGTIELLMNAPALPAHLWPPAPARDDFSADRLALAWNFRGNPAPDLYSLTLTGLQLRGTAATLDDAIGATWLGRRQTDAYCEAATQIHYQPTDIGDEAGLCVLMNERHHYEVFFRGGNAGRQIAVRRRIGDLAAVVAAEPIGEPYTTLVIRAEGDIYKLGYVKANSNEPPIWLAEGEAKYLSSEVAGGFTGVYFGLYCTARGGDPHPQARFHWFEYKKQDRP